MKCFFPRQSAWQVFHFQNLLTEVIVYVAVCVRAQYLTSETKILLIDLDHEFSINISKHTAVHPV